MVEIGGMPIIWHVMKMYSSFGLNHFILCLGYKGYLIKEFFANYALHTSDVTLDLMTGARQVHSSRAEPWRITLVDTGLNTQTGGRLKRVRDYVDGPFCMTYSDGVSDINVRSLIEFHHKCGKLATITAISPPGRFGSLRLDGDNVAGFAEKAPGVEAPINGGFFVLEPQALSYIDGDDSVWERAPLERLAHEGQLAAYRHTGFWQCMDTLRDRQRLEELCAGGAAPWIHW